MLKGNLMKTLAIIPLQILPAGPGAQPAALVNRHAQVLAVMPGIDQLPPVVLMADRLLISDTLPLAPMRRLVVLVPTGAVDVTGLARRVWQLAENLGFSVLYLALAPATTETAAQRRRLAELASMTTGRGVHARALVSPEKSWPQALAKALYSGDLLVCLANHKVAKPLLRQVTLGEQLAETLSLPVYLLGGLRVSPANPLPKQYRAFLGWGISLAIMAVFFMLEWGVDRSGYQPVDKLVICVLALLELFFLFNINNWIG